MSFHTTALQAALVAPTVCALVLALEVMLASAVMLPLLLQKPPATLVRLLEL